MKISKYIKSNSYKLIIESSLIILFGYIIFLLDEKEFADAYINYLILLFVLAKVTYFIRKGFAKIIDLADSDVEYFEFLIFIAINISVIILSFSIDYFCVYTINPFSFSGLEGIVSIPELLFKFFYFSLLIFANIGIVKIVPESMLAEILVILETILSFVTIIFILSDFLSLKDSLTRLMNQKKKP